MSPAFDIDPTRGQVMITRFECPSFFAMVVVVVLHARIKRQVAQLAEGYLGAVMLRDWRARTVLSMSLWRDLDSVYSMGSVPRHIYASRVPHRLGINTRAGVFCYAGDWRQVMFGAGQPKPSPLEFPTDDR
ncbi:MAG TPA: hypothetical protein VF557_00175 [Jatrophihabitans sp.]|uniref:hypothetical protein n=1 Tax=Jatrophihabitans sp. TaxID=1932789 RepID=UPI002EEE9987